MAELCYPLEAAAAKLKISETVLLRLSQVFKIPEGAYAETGYLSFKGDLLFQDDDLSFIKQVKDRLLAGETLEQVRQDLGERPVSKPYAGLPKGSPQAASLDGKAASLPLHEGLSEILDPLPYSLEAEKALSRYKRDHQVGGGKVFERLLKEEGGGQKRDLRPSRRVGRPPTEDLPVEPRYPKKRQTVVPLTDFNGSWEHILKDCVQHPRLLPAHLKAAALLLKTHVLSQP